MQREIEIGGKVRPINFNFNCLEEFQNLTGQNPLVGIDTDPKTTKALLFCGLKYGLHEEGCKNEELEFSIEKVGSWLSIQNIARILEIYRDQSHPDKKKEAE